MFPTHQCMPKVDEANVDTSTHVEHPTDGFEHKKLEHVSNCESGPKNLKSLKLELRKMLI